jgi:putative hydrolase of the HAD superfamily
MQDGSQPRVVVCDLDGVVRRFDVTPQATVDAEHGLPEGTIAALAFDPERLIPAITGAVRDEEWRAAISRALSRQHPAVDAAAAVAAWSDSPGARDEDVVSLLRRVRERVPLLALTNATTRLRYDLARAGLDAVFERIVSSAEIGHAKPAPEAFEAAHAAAATVVGDASLDARDVLFVDDSAGNVAAAERFGWTSVRFTSAQQLATVCRSAGLLT